MFRVFRAGGYKWQYILIASVSSVVCFHHLCSLGSNLAGRSEWAKKPTPYIKPITISSVKFEVKFKMHSEA